MIDEKTLKSLLTNVKPATRNNISANCVFCGKAGHFFINIKTGLWDCKKCAEDGNIFKLLKHLGKLYLLEGNNLNYTLNKLDWEQQQLYEEIDLSLPSIKLPIGFTKLHFEDKNSFSSYLRKRKFTKLDFELYSPGYTELVSKFENYVLIPIYRDILVKGLIGRYIGVDKEVERYQNSVGTKFTKLLFGLDEITNKTETLIIVEGVFDKVSVTTELDLHGKDEIKCVATFGKKISEYQLYLLSRFKNLSNIIFMYDVYDAVNEMKRGGLNALNFFKNVYACKYFTNEDPGEMDHNAILKVLNSAEKIQDFVYNRVKFNPIK